uniref:Cadherin domain-containing protein n=1 Tax=Caenorhabditis tropicalis TaxID=1561998 RepID=A0A1I7U308_9PELO
MGRVGIFILLFAASLRAETLPPCKFTSTNGFYAHVPSNLPIGDVIFKGSVTPSDAEMSIANVRSDAFNETDWSDHMVIDQSDVSPGSYLVRLSSSLSLPVYPSSLKEANLFVTVVCNGYAYPLFTVHIDPTNRFAPQFYHEPYVVPIEKHLPIWTVIDTPVAAIDWDPQESYQLKFWLEDSHKGIDLVEEVARPKSKTLISGSGDWSESQLPSRVQLRVSGNYELPMTLRLIVSDNAKENPRKSTTFINLVEKSGATVIQKATVPLTTTTLPTTTTTVPTTTVTTTTTVPPTTQKTTVTTTTYSEDIVDSEVTKTPKELIEELKKALASIPKKEDDHDDVAIDFVAFGAKNREMNAIETSEEEIEKFSKEEEYGSTRFTQCSLRTTVPENSPKGTKVAHLEVMNRRNTTKIRLIDPDGTFTINEETDDVVILDPKLVDRELFSTLELVAEIENADPSVQCTRIRVYIDLDDENDNRPVFENENYFFHVAQNFPPGREIGRLLAQDIDQGSNGQITYHLLTENVPFQVGTSGKKGILMTTGRLDEGIGSWNLTVEARDHGEEIQKTAKVPVEIFVLGGGGAKGGVAKEPKKVVVEGVKTVRKEEEEGDVEVVTVIEEVIVEEEEEDPRTTTSEVTSEAKVERTTVKEEESEDVRDSESKSEDVKETEMASESESEDVENSDASPEDTEDSESDLEDVENSEDPKTPISTPEDVQEAEEDPQDPPESEDTKEITPEAPRTPAPEAPTSSSPPPPPSEDVNHIDDVSSEEEEAPPTSPPTVFSFPQTDYEYDAFGMEIRENDVLGKVEASPNVEFYAVDREVGGWGVCLY